MRRGEGGRSDGPPGVGLAGIVDGGPHFIEPGEGMFNGLRISAGVGDVGICRGNPIKECFRNREDEGPGLDSGCEFGSNHRAVGVGGSGR